MFWIFEFLKMEVQKFAASSALSSNHRNGVIFCIWSSSLAATQRNELPQPAVARVKPSPDQHAHINREQDVAEQRQANAQLAGDCAAQIACQQDRAKNRSTRNREENNADEQNDPDDGG